LILRGKALSPVPCKLQRHVSRQRCDADHTPCENLLPVAWDVLYDNTMGGAAWFSLFTVAID